MTTTWGEDVPLLAVVVPDTTATDMRLVGQVDLDTVSVLDTLLEQQIATGHLDVHMDLPALAFCDVRGLRALLEGRRRVAAAGGRLTLTAPRPLLVSRGRAVGDRRRARLGGCRTCPDRLTREPPRPEGFCAPSPGHPDDCAHGTAASGSSSNQATLPGGSGRTPHRELSRSSSRSPRPSRWPCQVDLATEALWFRAGRPADSFELAQLTLLAAGTGAVLAVAMTTIGVRVTAVSLALAVLLIGAFNLAEARAVPHLAGNTWLYAALLAAWGLYELSAARRATPCNPADR